MKKFISRFFLFLGGMTFLSLLFTIGGALYHNYTQDKPNNQTVLALHLKGLVSEGPQGPRLPIGFFKAPLSLYEITTTLEHAAHDPQIKGVFIRTDQVALGMAQTQEMRAALQRFRATGKFALVHSDSFGEMTGGTLPYYLASAFDEIALQPMGELAFVGLSMELPFIRRFLDEYNITPRFDQREEFKGVLETFTREDISHASRTALQGLLNTLMNQIVTDIAHDRELKEGDIYQLAQEGSLFDPEKAKQLGFVDHVAYLDEFEAYALKKAGTHGAFFPFEAYASNFKQEHALQKTSDKIALVFAEGDIQRAQNASPQSLFAQNGIASENLRKTFEQIFNPKHPKPKAIVLRINSPGGAPVPSETIWRLLQRARSQGVKVVISMGDTAASGGYWIATAGDKIVAQPGTITGSIGVAGGKVVLEKLWERLGVKWDSLNTNPYANSLSPHQDFTQDQWENFQKNLDHTYATFLTRVVQGRRLSPQQARDAAKGRVWVGSEAQNLGLVDNLGDLHSAIELAKEISGISAGTPCDVMIFPRKQPWNLLLSESFADMLGGVNLPQIFKGFFESLLQSMLITTYKIS